MCGIAGWFGAPPGAVEVRNAFAALRHRGPDGENLWTSSKGDRGLLHARLSIIDLSTHSSQPMSDSGSGCVIVFNGEIYNYREIRTRLESLGHRFGSQGDTEVLLRSYLQWGESCLDDLRGMFAFVIHDPRSDSFFCARDRLGIKPFYFGLRKGSLYFASECGVIRTMVPEAFDEVDPEGVSRMLTHGSVKGPRTIWRGIENLPPGCSARMEPAGRLSIRRYYGLAARTEVLKERYSRVSERTASEELSGRLAEAARLHRVADVPVGSFLSGGIDSACVTSELIASGGGGVRTFTLGFGTEIDLDERKAADRVANHLGCRHSELIVEDADVPRLHGEYSSFMDQPSCDGFNGFLICGLAARELKVVVSGLGGDEVFGGYDHFRSIVRNAHIGRFAWPLGPAIRALYASRPNRFLNPFRTVGLSLGRSVDGYRAFVDSPVWREVEGAEPRMPVHPDAIRRISLEEIQGYLSDTLLRDADVVSMAHGLELRPMLLDHELVEFGLALPDGLKVRGREGKRCLKRHVKRGFPEGFFSGRKRGFELPYATWLNGVMHGRFADLWSRHRHRIDLHGAEASLEARISDRDLGRWDWVLLNLMCWMDGRAGARPS